MSYNTDYVDELAQCGVDRLTQIDSIMYARSRGWRGREDDEAFLDEMARGAYNYLRSAAHVARTAEPGR